MDDHTREIFERAVAMIDHVDEAQVEWEREAAERDAPDALEQWAAGMPKQRRSGSELVYKTYEPPQQQSTTMDAATQAGWDAWVTAHIKKALAAQPLFSNAQIDTLAEFVSEYATKRINGLQQDIGALRADIEILRTIVKSHNVTPIKSDRDAA
jgi:hypothetical protein